MRNTFWALLILAVAFPVVAGDLHGKVVCKGLRDCADAVVYIGTISGKSFPAPNEHAKMDQKNLAFSPRALPVLVGSTVDFLTSASVLPKVCTPEACAEKFNLGSWPQVET